MLSNSTPPWRQLWQRLVNLCRLWRWQPSLCDECGITLLDSEAAKTPEGAKDFCDDCREAWEESHRLTSAARLTAPAMQQLWDDSPLRDIAKLFKPGSAAGLANDLDAQFQRRLANDMQQELNGLTGISDYQLGIAQDRDALRAAQQQQLGGGDPMSNILNLLGGRDKNQAS